MAPKRGMGTVASRDQSDLASLHPRHLDSDDYRRRDIAGGMVDHHFCVREHGRHWCVGLAAPWQRARSSNRRNMGRPGDRRRLRAGCCLGLHLRFPLHGGDRLQRYAAPWLVLGVLVAHNGADVTWACVFAFLTAGGLANSHGNVARGAIAIAWWVAAGAVIFAAGAGWTWLCVPAFLLSEASLGFSDIHLPRGIEWDLFERKHEPD